MKLTGKCKEEFEKWYVDVYGYDLNTLFYNLKPSMQWGVYQDYFDSVEVDVDIVTHRPNVEFYFVLFIDNEDFGDFNTRQEARDKAIEKANEIRNEQLK